MTLLYNSLVELPASETDSDVLKKYICSLGPPTRKSSPPRTKQREVEIPWLNGNLSLYIRRDPDLYFIHFYRLPTLYVLCPQGCEDVDVAGRDESTYILTRMSRREVDSKSDSTSDREAHTSSAEEGDESERVSRSRG